MGIYLPKTTPEGIEVNYWTIQNIKIDRQNRKVSIIVVPYVSKAARDAGAKPYSVGKITVNVEDLQYPDPKYGEDSLHYTEYFSSEAMDGSSNIYGVAYNYIKLNDDRFSGAVDC